MSQFPRPGQPGFPTQFEDKLVCVTLSGSAWLRVLTQLMGHELCPETRFQVENDWDRNDIKHRGRVLQLLFQAAKEGAGAQFDQLLMHAGEMLDEANSVMNYDPTTIGEKKVLSETLGGCVMRADLAESLWSKMRETKDIWDSFPPALQTAIQAVMRRRYGR